ncbi:MAG TPA: hypothetical protein PLL39_12085 [Rhodocyclaceae bacterium]|nr:hypothetical protein [Rhodocyclaceae bacterium]
MSVALRLAPVFLGALARRRMTTLLSLLAERVRASGAIGVLVTHSAEAAASADRVLRLTPDGLTG